MSASSQADNGAADAHDDDDGPVNELLPGEPHTPMWLPLLGGVLALLAILAFLLTPATGQDGGAAVERVGGCRGSERRAVGVGGPRAGRRARTSPRRHRSRWRRTQAVEAGNLRRVSEGRQNPPRLSVRGVQVSASLPGP